MVAPVSDEFWRALRARHPGLREALVADARLTAGYRGERSEFRSRLDVAVQMLRLAWVSDAFAAQALYRVKAALQARGVPVLPRLAHRLAMMLAQVSIGDPVVVHPGIYIVHGQVVIDGAAEIHSGVTIAPWVTIGLRAGDYRGAVIERNVSIGTGAKVIGGVTRRRGGDDRRQRSGRGRRPARRHGGRSAGARRRERSGTVKAMWRFRRKNGGATALADRSELQDEIERLSASNRDERDLDNERQVLWLRHLAGMRALEEAGAADFAAPDNGGLPTADGLPEFTRADVTPGVLRAAILRDGCVLVRGLIDREAALHFAGEIDRAFAERERIQAGDAAPGAYYAEFEPHPESKAEFGRSWIQEGGGVLAADSPTVAFEMLELFRAADLGPLVDGYLGEAGLISAHKTTLRKAAPTVPGAWHQDGAFMGPVRSLNLWLALSRCGDVAPGLDLVPRRLDHLVASQTDEAILDFQVSQAKAEEAAGDKAILRPIFEPGDALFFDEMFLHQTASDPSMPNPRFALESWFFGSSSFPADYAPVAPW